MNDLFNDAFGTPLFPEAVTQRTLDRILDAAILESELGLAKSYVSPSLNPSDLEQELSEFQFCDPIDMHSLLSWVMKVMHSGNVKITHPRYFGLFNPAPAYPSILAERVVATFNPQLASAKTSPAAVAIEAHTIKQVAKRAGLPSAAGGHFTNSGSEANYTALLCALTDANPAFRDNGARAFRSPPAIYISSDAHLAWLKIAHQAGIGRLSVRLVETDGNGRMSAAALSKAVSTDIDNGVTPVMIAATAGTTVAGMIDPLEACACIAREAGAWFHVDAAWGGAAIASDSARVLLKGLDRADSVTIDAHKWFATTMGCGMFITTRPELLGDAFGVAAPFMPASEPTADPYMNSIMWSRKFLGLRLFMNLAAAGWLGYGEHVDQTLALAGYLRHSLESLGWTTANPGSLGVLCAIPPKGFRSPKAIANQVVSSGRAWVSAATFEGREVVRICITNGKSRKQDVDALVTLLTFCGEEGSERSTTRN